MQKDKIYIMEWNINQRGRQWLKNDGEKDKAIPEWIVDEIPDKINILILTEFNAHAQNVSTIYSKLESIGFKYHFPTYYNCPWANDVLIAIRGEHIETSLPKYVAAYPNNSTDTFDYSIIPDNLLICVTVNRKKIHILGVRIKELDGNYEKRQNEMDSLIGWLNDFNGNIVIVGDFNNLRENTSVKEWNLNVLDSKLGSKYKRETPLNNHSWGLFEKNDKFDGYIKNDHLIHSTNIEAEVETEYLWKFINRIDYKLEEPNEYNQRKVIIPVCNPDHGILIGSITI